VALLWSIHVPLFKKNPFLHYSQPPVPYISQFISVNYVPQSVSKPSLQHNPSEFLKYVPLKFDAQAPLSEFKMLEN